MDEFQVGDMVRAKGVAHTGEGIREGYTYTVTEVMSGGFVRVAEAYHPTTGDGSYSDGRFELVKPAPLKDTPKAGDTVRVVLEGKASMVAEESFRIGWNAVHVDSNHTVSIEILKPAKPSVKDLPVGSAVQNSVPRGTVWLKLGDDSWSSVGSTKCFPDSHVDQFGWTLLVPQESV